MRCLIQAVHHRRHGTVAGPEQEHVGDVLTIGRGTDQDVYLPDPRVAFAHARLWCPSVGGLRLECLSRVGLYHNGVPTEGGSVAVGDAIRIGDHEIRVLAPPTRDHDLLLTVERLPGAAASGGRRPAAATSGATFGTRFWSWMGFILVLGLALVVPLTGLLNPDTGKALRATSLPDDRVWLAGDISPPHRYFGADCGSCHDRAFVAVRDEACEACHEHVPPHADPDRFDLPQLHHTRCAVCHREHAGADVLVPRDDHLCAGCHRDLEAVAGDETDLKPATDFGRRHPEFRPRLAVRASDDPDAWQRVDLDAPGLRQYTGLIFPHDVHLDADGIAGPDGVVRMKCGDCHELRPGEDLMEPVRMERHCASCHRLNFDPADPERTLPHGDVAAAARELREYYALQALQAESGSPALRGARRPGRDAGTDATDPAARARGTAAEVAAEVFGYRTCKVCHEVRRDPGGTPGWKVDPVAAQGRRLTRGRFSHAAHLLTPCTDCHDAEHSGASTDVLLPGIKTCRKCHGGPDADDRVGSTCTTCHVFHPSAPPPDRGPAT